MLYAKYPPRQNTGSNANPTNEEHRNEDDDKAKPHKATRTEVGTDKREWHANHPKVCNVRGRANRSYWRRNPSLSQKVIKAKTEHATDGHPIGLMKKSAP